MAMMSYGSEPPRIGKVAPGAGQSRGLIGGAMQTAAPQPAMQPKKNPNMIEVRAHTRMKPKKEA